MIYVTRDLGDNVVVYDDEDFSIEVMKKSEVISAMAETTIEGIDPSGEVTPVVVTVAQEDCNWLKDGGNIWEKAKSVTQVGEDDNGFPVFSMVSGDEKFEFKETYGDRLLFKSNLLVTLDDELVEVIGDLMND